MTEAWDRPVTFSAQEPIEIEATKRALRFVSNEEDDLIDGWIATARAYFEEQTGRQLINATWEYARQGAPPDRTLELPRPPLYGDVEIVYDDADGQQQTFDAAQYTVTPSCVVSASSPADPPVFDPYCGRGRVTLLNGASWPSARDAAGSFRVRRTCGYGLNADAIPRIIQTALYLLVAHYQVNRLEIANLGNSAQYQQLPLGSDELIKVFKYSARAILPGQCQP